jgi:release factor glutamine methyltransferase
MVASQLLPAQASAAYQMLRRDFANAGVATPELDAYILTEWVTGFDQLALLTNPDRVLPASEVQQLTAARDARLAGRPVYRIIGRREFFGLGFELSEGTLEPRPDSECVIELALKALDGRQAEQLSILDLGTGTGILAISLLSRLPNADAIAVDISSDALSTATKNAELNGVAPRFQALQSNWFENVEGKFDLIISNPPYIRTAGISELSREVRDHDPILALDGGEDGLTAYRVIAANAHDFLVSGGVVVLEIGHDQRDSATTIFESCGFRLVKAIKDLAGNDRGLMLASTN